MLIRILFSFAKYIAFVLTQSSLRRHSGMNLFQGRVAFTLRTSMGS